MNKRVTVWWKLQAVLAIDVCNISGGSIFIVYNKKKHIYGLPVRVLS